MRSLKLPVFLFVASALAAPNVSKASTVYTLISTGHTGPNTQADAAHETQFKAPSLGSAPACPAGINCAPFAVTYFDATFNWLLGGGQFTIKTNGSVDADINLSLYDMTGITTLPDPSAAVASSTVKYNAIPPAVTSQYLPVTFLFANGPYLMQTGHRYMARVTSPTGIGGSSQYFIKDPTDVKVADLSGNPPTPETVPEPSSLATACLGAGLLAFNYLRSARLRRSR